MRLWHGSPDTWGRVWNAFSLMIGVGNKVRVKETGLRGIFALVSWPLICTTAARKYLILEQ